MLGGGVEPFPNKTSLVVIAIPYLCIITWLVTRGTIRHLKPFLWVARRLFHYLSKPFLSSFDLGLDIKT